LGCSPAEALSCALPRHSLYPKLPAACAGLGHCTRSGAECRPIRSRRSRATPANHRTHPASLPICDLHHCLRGQESTNWGWRWPRA